MTRKVIDFDTHMIKESAARLFEASGNDPQELEVKGIIQRLLYDDTIGVFVSGRKKASAGEEDDGEDYYTSLDGENTPDQVRGLNQMGTGGFANEKLSKIVLTQMPEPESAGEYEERKAGEKKVEFFEIEGESVNRWAQEKLPDLSKMIETLDGRYADAMEAFENTDPNDPARRSKRVAYETADTNLTRKIELGRLLMKGGMQYATDDDIRNAVRKAESTETNKVIASICLAYLKKHAPEYYDEYTTTDDKERKDAILHVAKQSIESGGGSLSKDQTRQLMKQAYSQYAAKKHNREQAEREIDSSVSKMEGDALVDELMRAKAISREKANSIVKASVEDARRDVAEWKKAVIDYEPRKIGTINFRGKYDNSYDSATLSIYIPVLEKTDKNVLETKLKKYTFTNSKPRGSDEIVRQFTYDPSTGEITLAKPITIPENNLIGKDVLKERLDAETLGDVDKLRAIYASIDDNYEPYEFARIQAKKKVDAMPHTERIALLAKMMAKQGETQEESDARTAKIQKEYREVPETGESGMERWSNALVDMLTKQPDSDTIELERKYLINKIAESKGRPKSIRYKIQKYLTYAPDEKPFLPTRIMGEPNKESLTYYQPEHGMPEYVIALTSKRDWEQVDVGDERFTLTNAPDVSDKAVHAGSASISNVTQKELIDKFNAMSDTEFAKEFAKTYGIEEDEAKRMMTGSKDEAELAIRMKSQDDTEEPAKYRGRKQMTQQMAKDLTGKMDNIFVKLVAVDKRDYVDEDLPEPVETINYWVRFAVETKEMKKHGEERVTTARSKEYLQSKEQEMLGSHYRGIRLDVNQMTEDEMMSQYSELAGVTEDEAHDAYMTRPAEFKDNLAWLIYDAELVDMYVKYVKGSTREHAKKHLDTNRKDAVALINEKVKLPKDEPTPVKQPRIMGIEPDGRWAYDYSGMDKKEIDRFKKLRQQEGAGKYATRKDLEDMPYEMLAQVYDWLGLGNKDSAIKSINAGLENDKKIASTYAYIREQQIEDEQDNLKSEIKKLQADAQKISDADKREEYDKQIQYLQKQYDDLSAEMKELGDPLKWINASETNREKAERAVKDRNKRTVIKQILDHVKKKEKERFEQMDLGKEYLKLSLDQDRIKQEYSKVISQAVSEFTDDEAVERYAELSETEEDKSWDTLESVGREKFNELIVNSMIADSSLKQMQVQLRELGKPVYKVTDEDVAKQYVSMFSTDENPISYAGVLDHIREVGREDLVKKMQNKRSQDAQAVRPERDAAKEQQRKEYAAKRSAQHAQRETSPFRDKLEDMDDEQLISQYMYRSYPETSVKVIDGKFANDSEREKLIDAAVNTQKEIMAARFRGEETYKITQSDNAKKAAYNALAKEIGDEWWQVYDKPETVARYDELLRKYKKMV